MDMIDDKKYEIIKKILKLDKLPDETLRYYYFDKYIYCCDLEIDPMFDDIKFFDYLQPIKKLSVYFKNSQPNYYKELYEKYSKEEFSSPLFLKDYDYDHDEILLQYVKCFDKMSILLIWPISNIKNIYTSNFYDYLLKNGGIHAIKEMDLSYKQIQGIIYQIYYDKSGFKDLNSIKGKQQKSKANRDKNKIFIIFYIAKNFDDISGKDAPLKIKLRELLRENSGEENNVKLNFFLHINDTHTQLVELAQLFCNKNSMRLLQYQRLDRILLKSFDKSLLMLMTLKNWLYQEIEPIDHMRFMLFSSIVIYSLGLRDMNDLDMFIHYLPKESKTENFFEKIEKYIENEETRFPFVEPSIKERQGWSPGGTREYLIEWYEKEWPAMYNARSMDDTILNPRFHYYYFGIKVISMIADIKRRIQRSRPAAYADLIALIILTKQNINLPELPEGYWKNHEYFIFSEKEKKILFKKIIFYLRKRYGIDMNSDKIKSFFG